MTDRTRYCYRVKLPTQAQARRILALKRSPEVSDVLDLSTPLGAPVEGAEERVSGILCGAMGPPCFHCGGVADALCDFPLGDENRTCDRPLCLECAPEVQVDKNYCHDHDERGRGLLLFPQPKRVILPPGPPARKRARPLPKAPDEAHRWRVRQGILRPRGDGLDGFRSAAMEASHGAVLTGWKTELDARRFAVKVGGYVETWDEFVVLWRLLYPLAPRRR